MVTATKLDTETCQVSTWECSECEEVVLTESPQKPTYCSHCGAQFEEHEE